MIYTGDELKDHLVNSILPYENNQMIPSVPKVNLPTRQKTLTLTLGTVSHDVQSINEKSELIGEELKEKAEEELEKQDIDGSLQAINAPEIDGNLIGKRIQYKFKTNEVNETTGEAKLIWFTGKVYLVKNNGKVRIEWDEEMEDDSDEKLLPSKWNKQVQKSWRMDVEKYTTLKYK